MDLHHFAKCGFLLTFLCLTLPRQQAPLPQRRNGIAGHGPAGGAVADVADYGERACRPPPGPGQANRVNRRGPRRAPDGYPDCPQVGSTGGRDGPPPGAAAARHPGPLWRPPAAMVRGAGLTAWAWHGLLSEVTHPECDPSTDQNQDQ